MQDGVLQVTGGGYFGRGIATSRVDAIGKGKLSVTGLDGVSVTVGQSNIDIGHRSTVIRSDKVELSEPSGSLIFSASSDVCMFNSSKIKIAARHGVAMIGGPLRVDEIENVHEEGKGLTLSSAAQTVSVTAAKDVSVSSDGGNVVISAGRGVSISGATIAATDVSIKATSGDISLAGRVTLPDVAAAGRGGSLLCVCGAESLYPGRLYTGNPSCAISAASSCSS